ncbi:hypothetical protein ACFPRL_12640 [Pseudoclavibacter helvolus]
MKTGCAHPFTLIPSAPAPTEQFQARSSMSLSATRKAYDRCEPEVQRGRNSRTAKRLRT